MPGNWLIGVLISNVWSFAGDEDAAEVNSFLLQPILNYNLVNGWYLTTAPVWTANWDAEEAWSVPLGGGAGKLHRFGNLPIDFKAAYYYNVVRPERSTDWGLLLSIKFLLPTPGR